MTHRIRNNRFFLLLTLALASFALVFGGALSASAHDQLIDSSPLPDEELSEAPTEATLRFSAEVVEIGVEFALVDSTTDEVLELPNAPLIEFDTVTQSLPALDAGSYALNWRVVSQDGHPISGTIDFTVEGSAAEEAPATQPATEPGTDEGTAGEDPGVAEQADEIEAADNQTGDANMTWLWIVVGIVAVGVAAAAIIGVVVRMRRGNTPGPDSDKK